MLKRVRVLFVILTLVVVATAAVQAAPQMGPNPASESGSVLDRLWGWWSALFQAITPPPGGDRHSTWDFDGSHGDPNGIH